MGQKSLKTPLRNIKMAPDFDIKRAFEINLDHKKIHRRFDEGFFSFPHGGIDLFYFFQARLCRFRSYFQRNPIWETDIWRCD